MKFVFEAQAKPVKRDGLNEIGAWTDGIGIFCEVEGDLGKPAYRLKAGKKYKVTIEPLS